VQIVTDSASDLTADIADKLQIHIVPLSVHIADLTYTEGDEIQPDRFYYQMAMNGAYPSTSQPAVGEFVDVYRRLAAVDPEIISIHISERLSGTINSARTAATLVPEAHITLFDSRTLSMGLGWQVLAAARARDAGWSSDQIIAMLERVRAGSNVLCALQELKYLVHGGRISHIKGLVASILQIKPVIGVDIATGSFAPRGQARTLARCLDALVAQVAREHIPGSELRTQIVYTANPVAAEKLRDKVDQVFKCHWLPVGRMGPVLGAHAGPNTVGLAYAAEKLFAELPWETNNP
jgi:DegV family protein with EDD domain